MATKFTLAKALKEIGITCNKDGVSLAALSKTEVEVLYDKAVKQGKLEEHTWRKYY
ncbi:MAG: hypothetical protein LBV67_05555 [Streptococcaceae bacterium]|jgi:hypothetical protein|nr:hypothetical protein [Streptococcaceae bacterium]